MTKEERRLLMEQKLVEMKVYENELYSKGIKYAAGIDEVGRGPLAGPVVAAAVILPPDFDVLGINDSKKLSEKKREELFEVIKERAVAYSFGVVDNEVIDEINILEATKKAMKMAVESLEIKPEHLLIDAVKLQDVDLPQTAIIKGDEKSISVAAASILAKVTRDRMMVEYAEEYTHYAFEKNKGYGTKAHYEGIEKAGICPIHRKTFLKKLL
ncbi:MAG: ribonuclease HII [Clostridiales bacterium]|nr:ribonuclease HII [Clostridiales bacterium]